MYVAGSRNRETSRAVAVNEAEKVANMVRRVVTIGSTRSWALVC